MTLGLAVLGSTGSVGTSVERVVRHHPDRFRIVALATYGNEPEALIDQIAAFRPKLVAVYDEVAAKEVARRAPSGVEVIPGAAGLLAAATHDDVDRVVSAVVGSAGLAPAHAALAAGKDLALANKESLVVAGRILTELASETGATILPIDSEHAALHQAMRGGRREEVRSMVLTASGGPFWRRDPSTFASIRREEALRHPTWTMGSKITIDSATMMNKGLELIEACRLFGMPEDEIDVVVHPQSIVHSLVEFRDGSWLAQLSVNDMVFPVQYALTYPERWANEFPRLDLRSLAGLEFHPVDGQRFPALGLARATLVAGESATAVLNGANEEAVAAFLAGRISFPAIAGTVETVLGAHEARRLGSLEEAIDWDAWGRLRARETIA